MLRSAVWLALCLTVRETQSCFETTVYQMKPKPLDEWWAKPHMAPETPPPSGSTPTIPPPPPMTEPDNGTESSHPATEEHNTTVGANETTGPEGGTNSTANGTEPTSYTGTMAPMSTTGTRPANPNKNQKCKCARGNQQWKVLVTNEAKFPACVAAIHNQRYIYGSQSCICKLVEGACTDGLMVKDRRWQVLADLDRPMNPALSVEQIFLKFGIALLKLDKVFTSTAAAAPLCIPPDQDDPKINFTDKSCVKYDKLKYKGMMEDPKVYSLILDGSTGEPQAGSTICFPGEKSGKPYSQYFIVGFRNKMEEQPRWTKCMTNAYGFREFQTCTGPCTDATAIPQPPFCTSRNLALPSLPPKVTVIVNSANVSSGIHYCYNPKSNQNTPNQTNHYAKFGYCKTTKPNPDPEYYNNFTTDWGYCSRDCSQPLKPGWAWDNAETVAKCPTEENNQANSTANDTTPSTEPCTYDIKTGYVKLGPVGQTYGSLMPPVTSVKVQCDAENMEGCLMPTTYSVGRVVIFGDPNDTTTEPRRQNFNQMVINKRLNAPFCYKGGSLVYKFFRFRQGQSAVPTIVGVFKDEDPPYCKEPTAGVNETVMVLPKMTLVRSKEVLDWLTATSRDGECQ